ncbi:MAG: hypothetical protein QW386_02165 [Candidatus Bathyarchaeia archaeon]
MALPIARMQNFLFNAPDNGKIKKPKRKLNSIRATADSALKYEKKKDKHETIVLAKIPKITWFSLDLPSLILTTCTRAN